MADLRRRLPSGNSGTSNHRLRICAPCGPATLWPRYRYVAAITYVYYGCNVQYDAHDDRLRKLLCVSDRR